MIRLPAKQQTRKKLTIEIDNFRGGTNKLLDEARLQLNEAKTTRNLIQVGDGQWAVRWGTAYYGADIGDTIDGASEYLKSDGTTEMIAISGGKAYKSTDGGSWTEVTGATFTADTQCYFMQIASYLYIANGTDALARYNGTTLSTYSGIDAPASLSGAATSTIAGGNYTYWAEVTALNEVGETVGSTEASVAVSKERDNWTSSTDKITWNWADVANATRYQLYISDEEGDEELLTSTTASTFTDDGSEQVNPYITPPLENTTTAPKFKSMCVSGNRIWATNNTDSMYTVYFSGTGTYIGTFSDFYGGGWINLEKGGREIPQSVVHYQSGSGEGRATVLAKTPEGRGAVWQLNISTATVGDTSFSIPSAVKVVGSFGTESLLSVVQTTNDIMFANRRGWFSLGPKQNYYGVLRTEEISSKIRPYWRSLSGSKIGDICAYFYDAKVFISVPTSSTGNNKIIILDSERGNWNVEWTIGAKQFLEYTTTTGVTKLLYVPLTGSKLIEIGENIQGDLGSTFTTDYQSGRYPINKLWKEFARIDKVYVKLASPRGSIGFEVSGTKKKQGFRALASKTISPLYALVGLGYDPLGSVELGDTDGTATLYSDSADIRYVSIRKKIRDFQLRLTTGTIDSFYTLLGFIVEGTPVSTNPPREWKVEES